VTAEQATEHALNLSIEKVITEHDMIAVPLLILSMIGVVFVLYSGKEILVPFVISTFLVYLMRPLFLLLTTPFSRCSSRKDGAVVAHDVSFRAPNQVPGPGQEAENCQGESATLLTDRSRSARQLTPHVIDEEDLPAVTCCPFTCRRLPAAVAALITMLVAIMVLVGIVFLIIHSIQTFQKDELKLYEAEAQFQVARIAHWTNETFHVDASQVVSYAEQEGKTKFQLSDFLQTTIEIIFNTVSIVTVVLLFVVYLLPEQTRTRGDSLRGKIDKQITHYIGLKSLISFGAAVAVFFIQGVLFHLPMSVLFACLTFIFNFIPNIGAFVASAIPLPIILLDPNMNDVEKILCFGLPVLVHFFVGNWVEPTVFGSKLELHPITVLLSLAFWFAMWGTPGAILSVPITAVIRIIFSHMQHPYAVVLLQILEGKIGAPDKKFK
jgi:AI-2 transport protein TqsA